MLFEQLNEGPCRSYLVGASNLVAIIDPLLNFVDKYLAVFAAKGLKLTHAIDTHTHADHISGCPKLLDLTDCHYVMHLAAAPKCVSMRVADGDEIKVGSLSLKVLHTPGHTQDSIALLLPDRILTGDVLFLNGGGAGRDDLPGGNAAQHWESLQKILSLPDHLLVYPAHEYRGNKPSSIAEQKVSNPLLQIKSKSDYVSYLEFQKLGPAEWMKDILKVNAECTREASAVFIPTDAPSCEIPGTAPASFTSYLACETPITVDKRVSEIQPEELKELLDTGESLLLLDVRELNELSSELGHIPHITHIPVKELETRISELASCKDKTIITICRSGRRATAAAELLLERGFKSVLVLAGGMIAWQELKVQTP